MKTALISLIIVIGIIISYEAWYLTSNGGHNLRIRRFNACKELTNEIYKCQKDYLYSWDLDTLTQ